MGGAKSLEGYIRTINEISKAKVYLNDISLE